MQKQRTEIMKLLAELKSRLDAYQTRHRDKAAQLLALEPTLDKLKMILASKHQTHFNAIETTISKLTIVKNSLERSYRNVLGGLAKIETSVTESKKDVALVKDFGEALVEYISDAHSLSKPLQEKHLLHLMRPKF